MKTAFFNTETWATVSSPPDIYKTFELPVTVRDHLDLQASLQVAAKRTGADALDYDRVFAVIARLELPYQVLVVQGIVIALKEANLPLPEAFGGWANKHRAEILG